MISYILLAIRRGNTHERERERERERGLFRDIVVTD